MGERRGGRLSQKSDTVVGPLGFSGGGPYSDATARIAAIHSSACSDVSAAIIYGMSQMI